MAQPSKSEHAWMHQFPPPIPEGLSPDETVVVRFDGVKVGEVDVIYAVIGAEDLARMPDAVMRDLEFSVRSPDGELRGSPNAFFTGSERRLSLYVNTEAYPDFLDEVRDAAYGSGLTPVIADGDLRLMTGPDGDISAPSVPAFVQNGEGYVPSLVARSYLDRVRPDHGSRDHDRNAGPDPF
jgi:hypothetical protein